MTRTRRAPAVVAVAASTLLLLTACNPAQAGSAAVVGDVRIQESRVNEAAAAAIAAAAAAPGGQGQQIDPGATLRANTNRLITGELLAIASAQESITVSQAEVDALIKQARASSSQAEFEAQIAAQAGVPPADIEDFARNFLIQQKLGAKLVPGTDTTAQQAAVTARLVQIADQEGVSVSPRYGSWNPEKAMIDGDLNDLSSPLAASPAPAATG